MLTSGRCAIGDAGLMKRARTSPWSGPDCQPLTHAGTRSFLPAELATKTGSCSRPPALQYLPLPPPRSLLVDPLRARARARVCARVFLSLPVSASVICLCLCLSLSLSLSQFVSVSVSLSVSSLRSLRLSHSLSPSVRACAARVCVSVFGCAQGHREARSEQRGERREERGERREKRGLPLPRARGAPFSISRSLGACVCVSVFRCARVCTEYV